MSMTGQHGEPRFKPTTVPVAFAISAAALALIVVALTDVTLTDVSIYLFLVAVASVVMIALALDIGSSDFLIRIRSRGTIALLVGVFALPTYLLSPMAYDAGQGRTGWVDGIGLWVSGIGQLIGLLVVGLGVIRSGLPDGDAVANRSTLLLGTLLGSSSYLLLQLAIVYDLA